MASSESAGLDIAYLVAALVEESGGEIVLSSEWFLTEENPFLGKRLNLRESDGLIHITLVD